MAVDGWGLLCGLSGEATVDGWWLLWSLWDCCGWAGAAVGGRGLLWEFGGLLCVVGGGCG